MKHVSNDIKHVSKDKKDLATHLVRIRPKQVAEQPLVGHVSGSHDAADLLHALQVGAQASVTAKDFFVDDGSDR